MTRIKKIKLNKGLVNKYTRFQAIIKKKPLEFD